MDRHKPQNAAQKSAQTYFTKAAKSDTLAKQTRKERSVTETKTAKLRELRLAKEAADKTEAERLAAETGIPIPEPKPKRAPAAKSTVVRFSY